MQVKAEFVFIFGENFLKGKEEITCNVRSTRYHRIDQLFFVFHVRPKIFLQRFRKEEEETRNVFLFIPLIFV